MLGPHTARFRCDRRMTLLACSPRGRTQAPFPWLDAQLARSAGRIARAGCTCWQAAVWPRRGRSRRSGKRSSRSLGQPTVRSWLLPRFACGALARLAQARRPALPEATSCGCARAGRSRPLQRDPCGFWAGAGRVVELRLRRSRRSTATTQLPASRRRSCAFRRSCCWPYSCRLGLTFCVLTAPLCRCSRCGGWGPNGRSSQSGAERAGSHLAIACAG